MADVLYHNFLTDDNVYDAATRHWEQFFDNLLTKYGYTRQSYLNNVTGNGTILRDGNPIFHAYIPEINRGIRIIQEDPEEATGKVQLGHWIQETEGPDEQPMSVLVISLLLTEETMAEAKEYILDFIEK